MNAAKRKAGRPVSDAMKLALEYVKGGMSIEAAAAETGLTFQAIYKSMRQSKRRYEWRVIVKGPDSSTRNLLVVAISAASALTHAKALSKYEVILLERGAPVETRRSTSQMGTTLPTLSGP